jgi:hypothetical protein
MDETAVRFRVRATPGKRVLRLPPAEFIERFLLHVLPDGFKRIRHYGLLAPAAKATKLALARQVLSVPAPDPLLTATVEEFLQRVGRGEWARCPHCGAGRFVSTAVIPPVRQPTPQGVSVRGPPSGESHESYRRPRSWARKLSEVAAMRRCTWRPPLRFTGAVRRRLRTSWRRTARLWAA